MILNLQEIIQWSYDEKDPDKSWEIYKLAMKLDKIDREHYYRYESPHDKSLDEFREIVKINVNGKSMFR